MVTFTRSRLPTALRGYGRGSCETVRGGHAQGSARRRLPPAAGHRPGPARHRPGLALRRRRAPAAATSRWPWPRSSAATGGSTPSTATPSPGTRWPEAAAAHSQVLAITQAGEDLRPARAGRPGLLPLPPPPRGRSRASCCCGWPPPCGPAAGWWPRSRSPRPDGSAACPLSMPDARHPDVGALLPALVARRRSRRSSTPGPRRRPGVGPGTGGRLPGLPHRRRPRRRARRAAAAWSPSLGDGKTGARLGSRHGRARSPADLEPRPPTGVGPGRRRSWPGAAAALAGAGGVDANQVVAYDLAHAAAGAATARAVLDYGAHGRRSRPASPAPSWPTCWPTSVAKTGRAGRPTGGPSPGLAGPGRGLRRPPTDAPAPWPSSAGGRARATSTTTSSWSARPSTGSPRRRSDPTPSTSTATNGDIPEEIIAGLAELGGFGLSVPEEYGGFATGGESDYLGMVVATEELSWGSLGIGGSLITRPEILTRALVHGGTEEQKRTWLPQAGHGRGPGRGGGHRARLRLRRGRHRDRGHAGPTGGWLVNGVKTWCTFAARADVLMLLARTDPDRSQAHRGLSMFVVEKPRGDGHGFVFAQDPARRTAGGRGAGGPAHRHHRLPRHALLRGRLRELVRARRQPGRAGPSGLGRGFYLQMQGFENGRLQTAARAVGVMQAAYEAGLRLRGQPPGLRVAHRRLPADPGQAGPHGRASSRPPASSPTRWPG